MMNRLKYFWTDHREQFNVALTYTGCIAVVVSSTWIAVGCLIAMAAHDIWKIRS